jgi:hypothetical protein
MLELRATLDDEIERLTVQIAVEDAVQQHLLAGVVRKRLQLCRLQQQRDEAVQEERDRRRVERLAGQPVRVVGGA